MLFRGESQKCCSYDFEESVGYWLTIATQAFTAR